MVSEENRLKAKKLTEQIYHFYGSGTGWLFGIPVQYKDAVECVVGVVLEMEADKNG